MTTFLSWLTTLLHAGLIGTTAPLVAGWRFGRMAGRSQPMPHPILQPWRDLRRLARRQAVVPAHASFLFLATPGLVLAATGAAALLVPSFAVNMATAPLADLVTLFGLLVAGRALPALAAMDTGQAWGGLAASRAMQGPVLTGPALLLVALALGLLAGSTNLDRIAATLRQGPEQGTPLVMAAAAVALVALADRGGRPAPGGSAHGPAHGPTHGHAPLNLNTPESSHPDYSGWLLAIMRYAEALRMMVWLDLVACLLPPLGPAPAGAGPVGWAIGLAVWAGKITVLVGLFTLCDQGTVRLARSRLPALLGVAGLLALVAVLLLLAAQPPA